jgi:hypothetical protein
LQILFRVISQIGALSGAVGMCLWGRFRNFHSWWGRVMAEMADSSLNTTLTGSFSVTGHVRALTEYTGMIGFLATTHPNLYRECIHQK